MRSCYLITVTGHPAMSVLCGFTPEGWPIGVQIMGRSQDEPSVLRLVHACEQATGFWRQAPSIAL
jgi:amidase